MKVTLTAKTQPLIDYEGNETLDSLKAMSSEEYLAWCARVSSPDNRLNSKTAPKLLKYLMDNEHWSPNEMINFSFEIETTRAIGTQLLRHRSCTFQEYSQRYAELGSSDYELPELRIKSENNRQSSTELANRPDLDLEGQELIEANFKFYKKLIREDIATECARYYLPLCTKTVIVMNGTFRSWIHYLSQRCDLHSQKEIQLIANKIKLLIIPEMPWTAEALGWC